MAIFFLLFTSASPPAASSSTAPRDDRADARGPGPPRGDPGRQGAVRLRLRHASASRRSAVTTSAAFGAHWGSPLPRRARAGHGSRPSSASRPSSSGSRARSARPRVSPRSSSSGWPCSVGTSSSSPRARRDAAPGALHPERWAIRGFTDLATTGGGFGAVAQPVAAILAFSAVVGGVAMALASKSMAREVARHRPGFAASRRPRPDGAVLPRRPADLRDPHRRRQRAGILDLPRRHRRPRGRTGRPPALHRAASRLRSRCAHVPVPGFSHQGRGPRRGRGRRGAPGRDGRTGAPGQDRPGRCHGRAGQQQPAGGGHRGGLGHRRPGSPPPSGRVRFGPGRWVSCLEPAARPGHRARRGHRRRGHQPGGQHPDHFARGVQLQRPDHAGALRLPERPGGGRRHHRDASPRTLRTDGGGSHKGQDHRPRRNSRPSPPSPSSSPPSSSASGPRCSVCHGAAPWPPPFW